MTKTPTKKYIFAGLICLLSAVLWVSTPFENWFDNRLMWALYHWSSTLGWLALAILLFTGQSSKKRALLFIPVWLQTAGFTVFLMTVIPELKLAGFNDLSPDLVAFLGEIFIYITWVILLLRALGAIKKPGAVRLCVFIIILAALVAPVVCFLRYDTAMGTVWVGEFRIYWFEGVDSTSFTVKLLLLLVRYVAAASALRSQPVLEIPQNSTGGENA